jgi:flagellar protein FlbD
VIILTRLNGPEFALNPDLIERADITPDTVITLVDGTKYIIAEPLAELARRIRAFRASIIAEAQRIETIDAPEPTDPATVHPLTAVEDDMTRQHAVVVQMHRREH